MTAIPDDGSGTIDLGDMELENYEPPPASPESAPRGGPPRRPDMTPEDFEAITEPAPWPDELVVVWPDALLRDPADASEGQRETWTRTYQVSDIGQVAEWMRVYNMLGFSNARTTAVGVAEAALGPDYPAYVSDARAFGRYALARGWDISSISLVEMVSNALLAPLLMVLTPKGQPPSGGRSTTGQPSPTGTKNSHNPPLETNRQRRERLAREAQLNDSSITALNGGSTGQPDPASADTQPPPSGS